MESECNSLMGIEQRVFAALKLEGDKSKIKIKISAKEACGTGVIGIAKFLNHEGFYVGVRGVMFSSQDAYIILKRNVIIPHKVAEKHHWLLKLCLL
jgi:hypothetical protein